MRKSRIFWPLGIAVLLIAYGGVVYMIGYGRALDWAWETSREATLDQTASEFMEALNDNQTVYFGGMAFVPRKDGKFSFLAKDCKNKL